MLDDASAHRARDLDGAVLREGIDDEALVAPGHALQAVGDVVLFVEGVDVGGDLLTVCGGADPVASRVGRMAAAWAHRALRRVGVLVSARRFAGLHGLPYIRNARTPRARRAESRGEALRPN